MGKAMDAFVEECQALRALPNWPQQISGAMKRLLAANGLADELMGELDPVRKSKLYIQSPDLTIYSVYSEGGLRGPPHDHATNAVVALVEGVEQYKTYRVEGGRCVETGTVRVRAPAVAVMSEDTIHAIWNEPGEGGLSLHAYGNTHFDAADRRLWDPVEGREQAFDHRLQFKWTQELSAAALSTAT